MKKLITISLLTILLLGITNIWIAFAWENKESTDIETITFVDYRNPSHAGPGPHPDDCSGRFRFTNGGLKWAVDTVEYDLLEDTIPDDLSPSDVRTAIQAAFDVWKAAEPNSPTFSEAPGAPNKVYWQSLGITGPVASASISYIPSNKTIVGFEIVFNSDLDWSTTGEAGKFDVQNVAAHEAGHVDGLDHVNAPQDGLETMYFLTDEGETIKRDLCDGDIAGIQALY